MMKKLIVFLTLIFTALFAQAGLFDKKPKFLKADQAFVFSYELQADELKLHWRIADGYYLYKKELQFNGENVDLAAVEFPPAEQYQDEFFGNVEIYRDELSLSLKMTARFDNPSVEVLYQGCTKGFCYPPESTLIKVSPPSIKQRGVKSPSDHSAVLNEKTAKKTAALSVSPIESAEQDRLAQRLFESKYAVFGFFLFGIGLAFTPCVLPMLPLLSAIVIGQGERPSNVRAFWLSVAYVQGMALTYTLLGLIVAAIGLPFQVALQSPYVLVGLSILFILLALSMFGLFSLQLPSSLQTKLTQYSQNQKSGAFGGVFVMGMIAGLVASPCTSAPLSGALLYVAQSGDLFTGALTLYLLALGMGVPLILITLFGNKILPKSGAWMEKVKTGFGFVMLALPVFLLSRVLPENWEHILWAVLGTTFFIWLAFSMGQNPLGWVLRVVFFILAMITVKPLQNAVWGEASAKTVAKSAVDFTSVLYKTEFKPIATYAELQQVLADNPHKIAMLDLYADWCVACKEFEKYTFSDPQVQKAFEKVLLLQVDMTKNSAENTELIKRLDVLGLPTIIFFDSLGEEITGSRISGFMPAEMFLKQLQQNMKNR